MIVSENLPFPLSFAHESLADDANQLIARFGLRLDAHGMPRLNLTDERLELWVNGFKPLFVDFNDVKWLRRSQAGKQQGLVKACQPQLGWRIIDATAGWGRDAAILSHFGAEILLLERHAMMAALLDDGLKRFSPAANAGTISLWYGDAFDYLQSIQPPDYPDVIYLDPMHPVRQKSALVKKDMQVLQHVIGADEDALGLLELARQRVRQRVVVKWPQSLKPLSKTSHFIPGKTVRFDLFLKR